MTARWPATSGIPARMKIVKWIDHHHALSTLKLQMGLGGWVMWGICPAGWGYTRAKGSKTRTPQTDIIINNHARMKMWNRIDHHYSLLSSYMHGSGSCGGMPGRVGVCPAGWWVKNSPKNCVWSLIGDGCSSVMSPPRQRPISSTPRQSGFRILQYSILQAETNLNHITWTIMTFIILPELPTLMSFIMGIIIGTGRYVQHFN